MTKDGNSQIMRIITLLITIFSLSLPAYAKYNGGTGEPNDPYQIAKAEDLILLGDSPDDYDRHFILTADIDLDPNLPGRKVFNRAVIAPDTDPNKWGAQGTPFTGIFDGNGKLISNFNYTSTSSNNTAHVGLFGWLERSEIKNLKLVDPNIIANEGSYVGALIGRADHATITGCCVEGGFISGKLDVGGLIGYCIDTSVSSCYSIAGVTGERTVGGLVGNMSGRVDSCYSEGNVMGQSTVGGFAGYSTATLMSCYSTADVVCTDKYAGGLVGYNWREIISCRASGNVEGNDTIGGLAGINNYTITHSYANGVVHGNIEVGGLVGKNNSRIRFSYSTGLVWGGEYVTGLANGGSVYLCYWDIETSGVREGEAGKGKTTAQMQSASTFRGWGYECQWVLDEGNDYPRLIWEGTPGELLVDQLRRYDGGKGEPNDPYQINTAQQFASIAYYIEDYDKHFILTNDIDMSTFNPDEIIPIGSSGIPFTGSFFGNGHSIMNLDCRANGLDYMGLFGCIGPNGYVEDLQLINVSVAGNEYVGGLVGYNLGEIHKCSVTGTVEGNEKVGGLVGTNMGPITGCSSDSIVVGWTNVGGLVGISGSVSVVPAGQAGPPPGSIPYPPVTNISSCYSTGYVEGQKHVGGLAGENRGSIQFSYSASQVVISGRRSNFQTIGGLVGTDYYGVVLMSYWDAESSGMFYSAAGKSKTTEQMMSANTFSGWGYSGEWVIDDGNDYPRLAWEGLEGKPIVDAPNRYASGAGTPDDPYKIQTSDEFIRLANHPIDWDRCFVLTGNIDVGHVDPNLISPIGVYGMPFKGLFNGNHYTISNFQCLSETESYIGVFGSIGPEISYRSYAPVPHGPNDSGSVINLNIENVRVSGYCCVGGLAGYNSGIISNCSVTGNVTAVSKDAGGLLGFNDGEITDCYALGNVKSELVAGGLIGHNKGPVKACSFSGSVEEEGTHGGWCSGGLIGYNYSTVESCHFNGDITGSSYTGGLIGLNGSTVSSCSASGNVTGTWCVGGLVGRNGGSLLNCYAIGSVNGTEHVAGLTGLNDNPIICCYSSCTVTGQQKTGGLVGKRNYRGEVSNSFWDVVTSGQITSAGGTGKTTVEMQTASTFLEAGWDFVGETENGTEDIWWILEGQDYPRLWWEDSN